MNRSVRGIELTAAGKAFLDHARLTLAQVDAAVEELSGRVRTNDHAVHRAHMDTMRIWREETLVSLRDVLRRQILRPSGCDSIFRRPIFRLPPLPRPELREPERDADASQHQTGPEDQDAIGCWFQLLRAISRKTSRHALADLSANASRSGRGRTLICLDDDAILMTPATRRLYVDSQRKALGANLDMPG
jgi:hypothetical protein